MKTAMRLGGGSKNPFGVSGKGGKKKSGLGGLFGSKVAPMPDVAEPKKQTRTVVATIQSASGLLPLSDFSDAERRSWTQWVNVYPLRDSPRASPVPESGNGALGFPSSSSSSSHASPLRKRAPGAVMSAVSAKPQAVVPIDTLGSARESKSPAMANGYVAEFDSLKHVSTS